MKWRWFALRNHCVLTLLSLSTSLFYSDPTGSSRTNVTNLLSFWNYQIMIRLIGRCHSPNHSIVHIFRRIVVSPIKNQSYHSSTTKLLRLHKRSQLNDLESMKLYYFLQSYCTKGVWSVIQFFNIFKGLMVKINFIEW